MERCLPRDSTPLAAVLAQLRTEVDRFPSEQKIWSRGYVVGAEAVMRSALRRTPNLGWAWWPRTSSLVPPLAFPSASVDPARCWAEKLASETRVAFAHELAVVFARTFPREVTIRIYLEVFWGGMPA